LINIGFNFSKAPPSRQARTVLQSPEKGDCYDYGIFYRIFIRYIFF
jgi:hypothetical protein